MIRIIHIGISVTALMWSLELCYFHSVPCLKEAKNYRNIGQWITRLAYRGNTVCSCTVMMKWTEVAVV